MRRQRLEEGADGTHSRQATRRLRRLDRHLRPAATSAEAPVGTVAPEPADGAFRPAELACDIGAAVDDERLAPWVYHHLTQRGLVRFAGQTCDALTFGRFARRLRTDTSAAGFRSRMYRVNDEAWGGTSERPGTPGLVPGFPELMLMGNVSAAAPFASSFDEAQQRLHRPSLCSSHVKSTTSHVRSHTMKSAMLSPHEC